MKNLILLTIVLFSINAHAQSIAADYPDHFKVTISNPLPVSRDNALVVISPEQIKKNFKKFNPLSFVILDGEREIPSQYNRSDGQNPGIVFVLDQLGASETRELLVRFHPSSNKPRTYTKRTQAELSYKRGGEWKNR